MDTPLSDTPPPGETHLTLQMEANRIESQKLELEKRKLRWTVLSLFVPLLIAASSVAYAVWNNAQQARIDFQIKAAEIVMETQSPGGAVNRARFLATLFPDYLPADFAAGLQATDFTGGLSDEAIQIRSLLFNALADRAESGADVTQLWQTIFDREFDARNFLPPE